MKRLFVFRRAWKAHQKVIYGMPAMQANECAALRWHSLKIAYPCGFQVDDLADFQSGGTRCRCILPRPKPDRLPANQVELVVSDRRPESLVAAAAIPREVIVHSLAHPLKVKAEAVYARGSLFDKRRRFMADRATYCRRGQVLPVCRQFVAKRLLNGSRIRVRRFQNRAWRRNAGRVSAGQNGGKRESYDE